MPIVVNLLQLILPLLAVSIAVILLCFYHYSKKRTGSYDVTVPPVHDQSHPTPVPLPEDGAEMVCDRLPPRYSTVEPPPPYSLFEPKLTNVQPGGAPPAYDMYPITLPLVPHLWTSNPMDHNSLSSTSQPQRHRQASAT